MNAHQLHAVLSLVVVVSGIVPGATCIEFGIDQVCVPVPRSALSEHTG